MNDRELLEKAAKAYWGREIDDVCSVEWSELDNCIAYAHCDNQDHNGNDVSLLWNPLADDGDALRLAVKLNIEFACFDDQQSVNAGVWSLDGKSWDCMTQYNGDKLAATRRAIVRSAAAIEKGMT